MRIALVFKTKGMVRERITYFIKNNVFYTFPGGLCLFLNNLEDNENFPGKPSKPFRECKLEMKKMFRCPGIVECSTNYVSTTFWR